MVFIASIVVAACVSALVTYVICTKDSTPTLFTSFSTGARWGHEEEARSLICDFSRMEWGDCRIELVSVQDGTSSIIEDCSFERNKAIFPQVSLNVLRTRTQSVITIIRHAGPMSFRPVFEEQFSKDKTVSLLGGGRLKSSLDSPFLHGSIQICPTGEYRNVFRDAAFDTIDAYVQKTRDTPGLRYLLLRITPLKSSSQGAAVTN